MIYKNLVLSGGGIKGYYYIGCIKALYEKDLIKDIKNIIGTSVGAFYALLICLNYSYEEIYKTLLKINLKTKVNIYNKFDFPLFFEKYGFDNGDEITKIIDIFIKKKFNKKYITFKELYNFNNITLIISTTNLTNNKIEYFNHILTPEMNVNLALRMSISVPFIFTPVSYNNCLYIDGGLTNNFPIEYFKNELDKTLAISLSENTKYNNLDSIEKYIFCVLKCSFISIDLEKVNYYKKHILILNNNYSSGACIKNDLDFYVTDSVKHIMVNEGYIKTKEYIENKQYQAKLNEEKRIVEELNDEAKLNEEKHIVEELNDEAKRIVEEHNEEEHNEEEHNEEEHNVEEHNEEEHNVEEHNEEELIEEKLIEEELIEEKLIEAEHNVLETN